MSIQSQLLGEFSVVGDLGDWKITSSSELVEPKLELLKVSLSAPAPIAPPFLRLDNTIPQKDMFAKWTSGGCFYRGIPPNWWSKTHSDLATQVPLVQINNNADRNRVLIACSDALRFVVFHCGILEEGCSLTTSIRMFEQVEAPIQNYEFILRIDMRDCFYAEALQEASKWFSSFDEYKPTIPPKAAYDSIYSSWYTYHQEIFDDELVAECALAKEYGLNGIIIDDGWQTDDKKRGYAFCGDWEPSKKRFKNGMRDFARRLHAIDVKLLLWYSVCFVGVHSKHYERFKNKSLYFRGGNTQALVLDPRFPEVREYLIQTYENAMRDWELDGFKFDFIDNFHIEGEDPAIAEDYAGRDIKSVAHAVDALLTEVVRRLKAINPDVLIEFRQSYIGPAIRKYGNMFRVADCPGDINRNRVGIVDLRLLSGETAVHSDMLEWNMQADYKTAMLQLLNVIFGVPQISVKLEELPEEHRKALKFWLNFREQHRSTLLEGRFVPRLASSNYQHISAYNDEDEVVAVYSHGVVVKPESNAKSISIINASGQDGIVVSLNRPAVKAVIYDSIGGEQEIAAPAAGFTQIAVPASGLLVLTF